MYERMLKKVVASFILSSLFACYMFPSMAFVNEETIYSNLKPNGETYKVVAGTIKENNDGTKAEKNEIQKELPIECSVIYKLDGIEMPANEIVLPIMLMCYLKGTSLTDFSDYSSIGQILIQNNWNILTAINVMIFTVLHFPCTTTLLTIKKETASMKWTVLSFALPTLCGIVICILTNIIYNFLIY